jgi:uncharacterized protein (DUF736 family)
MTDPMRVPGDEKAQQTATTFRVEKQSYSSGAWRVLHEDGRQIFRDETFDHPFLGSIRLAGPVCFDRKRDAIAWISAAESLSRIGETE